MTQYRPSPGLDGPWQPASAAAPENPFQDAKVPSIAAVIQAIGGDPTLTPPRRAALAGGPVRPVDAGREPDQVASRAHDVVFRAVRAHPPCAGLSPVR